MKTERTYHYRFHPTKGWRRERTGIVMGNAMASMLASILHFDQLMDAAWCVPNASAASPVDVSTPAASSPSHPRRRACAFSPTAGGVASPFDHALSRSHSDARQASPAATHFDGDVELRSTLKVARRVQAARGVTAPSVALGCVEKDTGRAVIATTEGPHSPEQKHSTRPVETFFPQTQGE